jgi:hypothetical protein
MGELTWLREVLFIARIPNLCDRTTSRLMGVAGLL